MFEIIENLRAKPNHIKKQIAFLIALTLTGIIFVIWLTTFSPESQMPDLASTAQTSSSPLSNFSVIFSKGITHMKGQITNLKNSVSAIFDNSNINASSTAQTVSSSKTIENTP